MLPRLLAASGVPLVLLHGQICLWNPQGRKERNTRGYFVGSVVIAQNDNAGHHSTTVAPAIVSEKWAILS